MRMKTRQWKMLIKQLQKMNKVIFPWTLIPLTIQSARRKMWVNIFPNCSHLFFLHYSFQTHRWSSSASKDLKALIKNILLRHTALGRALTTHQFPATIREEHQPFGVRVVSSCEWWYLQKKKGGGGSGQIPWKGNSEIMQNTLIDGLVVYCEDAI